MKPIKAPFLICMILALATALGAAATGRAAGLSAAEASLERMVICADAQGPKTVLVGRDGLPVDLPHPCRMLCDDCLQAGAAALLTQIFTPVAPAETSDTGFLHRENPHHPSSVLRQRSRAPPARSGHV